MATRSRIGILNKDGTVKSIYCHWDGYPEENGKILMKHYPTKESVEALLEKGDMSVLKETVERCEYYVDRGETNVSADVYSNIEEYKSIREEYQYYLDQNNVWWYTKSSSQSFDLLENYFKNKSSNEEDED